MVSCQQREGTQDWTGVKVSNLLDLKGCTPFRTEVAQRARPSSGMPRPHPELVPEGWLLGLTPPQFRRGHSWDGRSLSEGAGSSQQREVSKDRSGVKFSILS